MPSAPGTMVNGVLTRALQFFQDPVNREKIQHQCIDPLLRHILDRLFPYIIITCILFSLILLMSLTSVGLLMFQLHTLSNTSTMASKVGETLAVASSVVTDAVSPL